MFDERVADCLHSLRPAERRVAEYFSKNREEVLISSAMALAERTQTSDATVVRTVKALGFAGMSELKQELAAELRRKLTPADRMGRTLGEVGSDPERAFSLTMDVNEQSLAVLREAVSPADFRGAVERMATAARVQVFGVGPSSAMADYLALQLGRIGLNSLAMTRTGILFADDLGRLRSGDLVVMLAYGRIYPEVSALLDAAAELKLQTILMTDTLAAHLRRRVDLVLSVPRGRADMLSMHTATLALIEALLVGVAAKRPGETLQSLKALNRAREKVVGKPMDLNIERPSPAGKAD